MFTVTVILFLVAGISAESWIPRTSAASDAQIRFAIENKYDTTGPGAKGREYAYKTYQTLDEALVAYADDPDTQLPELEKQRVLYKLSRPSYNSIPHVTPVPRYQPKTVDEYTGYKPQQIRNQNSHVQEYASYKPQNVIQQDSDYTAWKPQQIGVPKKTIKEFGYYKPHTVISDPVYPRPQSSYGFEAVNNENHAAINENSAHFAQSDDFDPNPQYSFSYGVHDKGTGDSKSAHETRDGDAVRGYYTFMDADGKQRTVHYTADDKLGFRATVQRTHSNSQ